MTLGGTYVACELVHSAILGHVVFLVRVILWKRQPHPLRQLPRRPLAHACPAACCWRPLLADRCQAAPRHKGKQDRRSRQRGTGALRPGPLGKKGRQGVPTGGCRPAGFASGQTCPLGGCSRKGSLSQVPGGPAHGPASWPWQWEEQADLDVVGEVLQRFGAYGLHGGDEAWQLVLGAGGRSLRKHVATQRAGAPATVLGRSRCAWPGLFPDASLPLTPRGCLSGTHETCELLPFTL